MASSENSQTWRKKENSPVVESESEIENENGRATNRYERIAKNENWRSGRTENSRSGNNETWRKDENSRSGSHANSRSGSDETWRSRRDENCRSGNNETWRRDDYSSSRSDENWRSGSDETWRTRRVENSRTRQNEIWRKEEKSKPLRIEEDYSETQIHGCWRILVDSTKESEEVWKSAMELHIEQPRLFPLPPRRRPYKKCVTMFIECYTSPCSDKAQIQAAAEAIRVKVYFPFIMHYVEAPIYMLRFKFMHTPNSEFYELEGSALKMVEREPPLGGNGEDASSNEALTEGYLRQIEIKAPRLPAINDIQPSSSYEIALPSEVTDEAYIYFPPTEEAQKKMRLQKGGKWMIYTGFDMSKHDEIWIAMIPFYEEGICVGLKTSTAMITEAEQFMGGGVIHCYTANSDDFRDVKRVVDRIRSVLLYNYVLHYKANYSSEAGRYVKEGCFSVSQYMDTVKGNFYKRDRYRRFSLEGL